jgi:uncharacterized cupin superfamily protein
MIFKFKYFLALLLLLNLGLGGIAEASQEFKKKPVKMTKPIKTLNPKAIKDVKKIGQVKMLSNTEYQRKIKAHNLKMKSQAAGNNQRARTNLSFQTQNDQFDTTTYDCDDSKRAVNIDAQEICDGIDNNCDGDVDMIDGRRLTVAYYLDADSDSWGDTSRKIFMCPASEGAPEGYASNKGDCNDKASTVYPGAHDEPNNGVDENCDGSK